MSLREIWYIDQYVGHPKYGNVYRNFYMAKELVNKGYKVRIFSASYSHLMYSPPITRDFITQEIIEGVEFNWVKVRKYKSGKGLARIFSIFEFTAKVRRLRDFNPPDVIITPSVPFLPYWSIRYLILNVWKSKSPKLILEIRDLWPLTFTTVRKVNKNNPFIRLLAKTEKHALNHVDYVISTLRMCQDYIDTIIDKPYKFKWIDNGINLPGNDERALEPKVENLIPKDKFIVGYTGTLGAANSMTYLIDAARLLGEKSDIHFIIVGDGYEKQNLVNQSAGLSNITFIPRIKKSLIPKVLALCDILYFSYLNVPELYKYGVSANKTYEYMLSGKPIVLSCPKMDYNIILEADCGKVVEPENAEAIAHAILRLYETPVEERLKFGANGKEFVLKNNTFAILAEKLGDVISNC